MPFAFSSSIGCKFSPEFQDGAVAEKWTLQPISTNEQEALQHSRVSCQEYAFAAI